MAENDICNEEVIQKCLTGSLDHNASDMDFTYLSINCKRRQTGIDAIGIGIKSLYMTAGAPTGSIPMLCMLYVVPIF